MVAEMQSHLSCGVGRPEDEAELLDVIAIVAAMEADDFHILGHLDPRPGCIVGAPPLLLVDLFAVAVEEADPVNVVFSLADVNLHGQN